MILLPRNHDVALSNSNMEDMLAKVMKGVKKPEDWLKELREDIF